MILESIGRSAPGIVLGLGALGSCLGILAAGTAAAAAWASEGRGGKKFSFQYFLMIAAPLSQTLYAMILMNNILARPAVAADAFLLLGTAVGCGVAECFSAAGQGRIGAAAIRCLNENGGKGLGLLIIALGIIETVGIFAMVFGLVILGKAG